MLFLGLTMDGSGQVQSIQAYLDEFQIPWLTGYGAMEALQSLGVQAFPTKIVVGADGRILWHDELGGSLDTAIEQAMANAREKHASATSKSASEGVKRPRTNHR